MVVSDHFLSFEHTLLPYIFLTTPSGIGLSQISDTDFYFVLQYRRATMDSTVTSTTSTDCSGAVDIDRALICQDPSIIKEFTAKSL